MLVTDENMPHFTVVPVEDNAPSTYDSLEGINWVDYRDTGQGYPGHGDTVSSDGKFMTRQTSAHHSFFNSCMCEKGKKNSGKEKHILSSFLVYFLLC